VIDDLDRTLERLLRANLPADVVSQIAISFAAPDNEFPPSAVTLPAIDLFLYDVRENAELRDPEWILDETADGKARRRHAPVRVDCSYLVTAWPSGSSTTPALDEHRLLGLTIQALLLHPTIPPELLQGALAGADPPLPTGTLQPGRLQSLGEFWQALGGKPKTAVHYTVTLAVEVGIPIEAGPPVREPVLRLEQAEADKGD
jgi:hypothetical protein